MNEILYIETRQEIKNPSSTGVKNACYKNQKLARITLSANRKTYRMHLKDINKTSREEEHKIKKKTTQRRPK